MNPFIAHLVGDFLLQNEWMAMNKRKSSFVCLMHVLVYMLPLFLTHLNWWQLLLIGATHFLQDRTDFVFWWVRSYKRVPKEHWGIIPLLVDQGFHILTIEVVIQLGLLPSF
ncbi:MAG TPA: DUF3307 domain-containing protein [Anaerolineales bacterium]|nr:DUF3307 domain-containing protein [Anaerolineales bacterium]